MNEGVDRAIGCSISGQANAPNHSGQRRLHQAKIQGLALQNSGQMPQPLELMPEIVLQWEGCISARGAADWSLVVGVE